MWSSFREKLQLTDHKTIARAISLVENEAPGYETFLRELTIGATPVIGITGPPGAGKSTITNELVRQYINDHKKVAVICVDPSSPFNYGAILGDRIRMTEWYAHPLVYIRSLASRGSLGGLSAKIIEVTDLLKASNFDIIIVETVGIGQSEVQIAGLADVTVLVLVPESGDEIQFMKAGVMEIADVFAINKADRPGADTLEKNLKGMLHERKGDVVPVIKTIASNAIGVDLLKSQIDTCIHKPNSDKRSLLNAEKAYQLIAQQRMKNIDKSEMLEKIRNQKQPLNIYQFIEQYKD